MNEHDTDLAAAYVLDALPAGEAEAFEAHLRGCAECRREVAELAKVVQVLPLATDQVEPPPNLGKRIVAAVQAEEEQEAAGRRPALKSLAGGQPRTRPARRPGGWQSALALVAALIIAILGIQDYRLQQQVNDQKGQVALQKSVTSAIASGAVQSHIPGTPLAPAASATMVQPRRQPVAYLLIQGLQPTPSNHIYQVWLIKTGPSGLQPRSAGVFTYGGSGTTIVKIPMSARGFPLAAVTLETCPNGCAGPHGPRLLLGKLTA